MAKDRPTLQDVARLSGVTAATVSRVLNKKKKFSASDAVRGRILAAAESLRYAPDLAARSLNRQSSNIIGVFTSPQTHVAEGINEMLLEGIAEVLQASEYDVFFNLSTARRHAVPFWRFDGAVLLQSPPSEIVEALDRRRVPYVCVNERIGKAVAQVLADDRSGMRQAVEHLHQLGHRRIAYANARATYLTHYSVAERHDTLIDTARQFGMELVPGHNAPFCSGPDFLRGSVRQEKATAIITYDHAIAVAVLGSAYAMDLHIPRDFSLLCFNDVFPVSLLPPPLTAIGVSGREMGRIGAGLLLNSLTSPSTASGSREIRVQEELVVRRSTAPVGFTPSNGHPSA